MSFTNRLLDFTVTVSPSFQPIVHRYTQVLQQPYLVDSDENSSLHPLLSNEAVARVFKRLANRPQDVVSGVLSTFTISPEYAAHFPEIFRTFEFGCADGTCKESRRGRHQHLVVELWQAPASSKWPFGRQNRKNPQKVQV
jgi:hypothetical protein